MGMWKATKRPSDFPVKYSEAVCAGPGEYTLERGCAAAMRREQKRFSAFKSACRRFPMHRAATALQNFETRTRIERVGETWLLILTVRKGFGELLAKFAEEN